LADETYVFGCFQLVPAQRLLLNRGRSLRLDSRALEILITLVECADDTVSKDRLIGRVSADARLPRRGAQGNSTRSATPRPMAQ
jgi:DNA-binding winged helix-turn-helix (wHTH) protein